MLLARMKTSTANTIHKNINKLPWTRLPFTELASDQI